jgi:hypothetical protein
MRAQQLFHHKIYHFGTIRTTFSHGDEEMTRSKYFPFHFNHTKTVKSVLFKLRTQALKYQNSET